jgi:hypothetical protein
MWLGRGASYWTKGIGFVKEEDKVLVMESLKLVVLVVKRDEPIVEGRLLQQFCADLLELDFSVFVSEIC